MMLHPALARPFARVLLLATLLASPALTGEEMALPVATVNWAPPAGTQVPPEFIEAVRTLLGNGLSDPRGGEFHKVKILAGDAAWSGGETPREGYGWVRAATSTEGPAGDGLEVVAVDGLTYPVLEDLGAAELAAFLAPPNERDWFGQAVPLDQQNIALPALLLVLGKTSLAEGALKEFQERSPGPGVQLYQHLVYRYKMQAAQYLMNRQDAAALPWAERLALVSRLWEGSGLPTQEHGSNFDAKEAELILRDTARRAAHPAPPVALEKITALEPAAQAAALIAVLDETAARQWGQPGGIDWFQDPIIKAFADLGEAAVPPLLEALELDERLTRSVSFHRDFFPYRKIHTAREAARVALNVAWPIAATVKSEEPAAAVVELHTLWASTRGLPPLAQWLEVLRDDLAGPDAWLQAAQALTDPVGTRRMGGWTTASPDPAAGMVGEPLRAEFGAEISQLLALRAEGIAPPEGGNSTVIYEFRNRLDLVNDLAKWDQAAALPALQSASQATGRMLAPRQKDVLGTLGNAYGRILTHRLQLGDATAYADYEALLKAATGGDFDHQLFRPLWVFPQDTRLQEMGRELLGILVGHERDFPAHLVNRTPILLSPAYREAFAQQLAADQVAGTAWVEETEQLVIGGGSQVPAAAPQFTVRYKTARASGSSSLPEGVDAATLPRSPMEFTAADLHAQELQSFKSAPRLLLVWPAEERAQARRELADWLHDPTRDWSATLAENGRLSLFSD